MRRFAALTAIAFMVGIGVASASQVSGDLGVGSSGTVIATLVSLTWTPDSSASPVPGPPWNGDVNSASDLSFNTCPTGALNVPGCLTTTQGIEINNNTPFCAAANSTTCPGGATTIPVQTFLQFEPTVNMPAPVNLVFELDGVGAGSNVDCATNPGTNVTCSIVIHTPGGPVISPVTLTKNSTGGTIVSIALFGKASDEGVAGLSGPNVSDWTGAFSATIPGVTPLALLESFCGTDDFCDTADVAAGVQRTVRSVSGSFTANIVPEPGTIGMFAIGIGLIGLSIHRRRRAQA